MRSCRSGVTRGSSSRFKSLLHLVKLNFLLNNHAAMVEKYESLLTYIDSVTSNELQDAIQRCARVCAAELLPSANAAPTLAVCLTLCPLRPRSGCFLGCTRSHFGR